MMKNQVLFEKWLNENIHKFHYKPILTKNNDYYFNGITKAIKLEIDYRQPEAMLSFSDLDTEEIYDYHTIEYIGSFKYDNIKGFYDADRVDAIYKYYDTYDSLIISEVFEPILKYCNELFKKTNTLYIVNYEGSTEGFIIASNTVNKLIKLIQKSTRTLFFKRYEIVNREKDWI